MITSRCSDDAVRTPSPLRAPMFGRTGSSHMVPLLSVVLAAAWWGLVVFVPRPLSAYWLIVPVVLVAARYGWRGGAIAALASGSLSVLAAPHLVAHPARGPVHDLVFFLLVGVLIALLMRSAGEVDRHTVDALNIERDLALKAVAERDALSARLAYEATHDTLTGLGNRSLFLEELERSLVEQTAGQLGILFVDLDDFKTVNDSFGHAAGDELLIGVAARLSNVLRAGDVVARFGGDEFAVLLRDASGDGTLGIANRLLGVLRAPFALQSGMASGQASGGLVTTAADPDRPAAEHAAELLRRADLAMYAAKSARDGRCVEFRDELQHAMLEKLALQDDITEAMIREEFYVHYQPVVDLETRRTVAVEALLRWHHERRGDVPPDVFVPIAEQSGAIVQIGLWVLERACRDLQRWDEQHPDNRLMIAVNLSARQLQEPSIGPKIARTLHRVGVDPRRLILEVTESLVMDDAEAAAATLWQLRALGIRIAVDDFGTGYSSLSRLVDLPLDDIKIDRSFIRELDVSDAGTTIIKAAIAMAHGLNLNVVAEGVETLEQLAFLKRSGCDQAQGYLFSRPCSSDEVSRMLSSGMQLGLLEEELDADGVLATSEAPRPSRPSATIIPALPRHR